MQQGSSSAPSPDHRIHVTDLLRLEFLVKENEQDSFKSVPLELANPLVDSTTTSKRTYLVEVNSGWFFALHMTSLLPLSPNVGFAAKVLIDNVPTQTNYNHEYLTTTQQGIISSFRGGSLAYPFQFAKSHIVDDPSELKNSIRKDVSVVGKIEMTFFNATFGCVGPMPQITNPTPIDKIKIKESQSKDKGICAVSSKAVPLAKSPICQFWNVSKDPIAEIIILYRDAIGMIAEKNKRGMLSKPEIQHTNTLVDIDSEPPRKKIKKENVDSKLKDRASSSSSSTKVIILDPDEESPTSQLTTSIKSEIRTDPKNWNIQQVQDWLRTLNPPIPESVIKKFEEEEISGKILFAIKDDDLKNVLGVSTFGKRRAILDGIETLRRI